MCGGKSHNNYKQTERYHFRPGKNSLILSPCKRKLQQLSLQWTKKEKLFILLNHVLFDETFSFGPATLGK